MAAKNTLFYRLNQALGNGVSGVTSTQYTTNVHNYSSLSKDDVIYTAKNKEDYELKLAQLRQQKLLSRQWKRAQWETTTNSLSNQTEVQMMYREADMMDLFPEIGAALDIYMEEATYVKTNGMMINVTSKSPRIKSVLEDLIYNRLSANTVFPMITRSTVKYGNTFMLLNITHDNGIIGWKQLPVYEMQRYENGMDCPYSQLFTQLSSTEFDKTDSTKFVWVGKNEAAPYRGWQVAHFRLLYDSLFLPYGVSALNKARRHWRMLSMMEDMMLMYRLDRSIERRVFKVNVGAIDEQDVPAYMDMVANEFKRTPIVDPLTGQLDLRKNIMTQMDDFFIPVRDPSEPNPIETLPAGQNMTAMDDIKFVQNKLCTALRCPKSFLNFEEAAGDGKNLSMLDVRFTRTINRIQQMMLMELTKVCIVHLFALGFEDDLTNFQLSMNNPSSQAEMLELDNLSKKIEMAKSAVADPGGGLPIMSITRACKQILGMTEEDIRNNLEELRLEKAVAIELEQTANVITKTGLFDYVDNLYKDPMAEQSAQPQQQQGGEQGGMPGGGGMMPPMGGDMDMGNMEGEGELGGADGSMDMGAAAEMEGANANGENNNTPGVEPQGGYTETLSETFMNRLRDKSINERKQLQAQYQKKAQHYQNLLLEHIFSQKDDYETTSVNNVPLFNENFLLNEELNSMVKSLDEKLHEKQKLED